MDYVNLLANVIAIFSGLGLYIFIVNTKWGKAHEGIQYPIMLMTILAAILLGGFIKWLL
ncbi:MAG: hypothetical protein HUJ71_03820 [Pseudobutyrivibrio sp.]|nr:hypothetical protein [Pseudobutyrivibrio sp.]